MSETIRNAADELRDFLFSRVYYPSLETKEVARAREIILLLFDYFVKNPNKMPAEYNRNEDSIKRRVTDYIAGMTDDYAILTAQQLNLSN